MRNFVKILLCVIVFNNICFGSELTTFDLFKANIVGKTGIEVYDYITPKLHGGIDYQIEKLQKHMISHGHWGYKTSISKRNTPINWPTFFIDPMMNLINNDENQKAFIVNIWNSKLLMYACDIPGCLGGVCLNGIIPNVQGIIFEDQSVERPSISLKDIARYRKENEISINVAKLGREPTATDFADPTDLLIAKIVYSARPKLVNTCSIRVILLQQNNSIEFNTMYLIS